MARFLETPSSLLRFPPNYRQIIRLDNGDKEQQAGTSDSSGAARDNGAFADNPFRGTTPDNDKGGKNSGIQSK